MKKQHSKILDNQALLDIVALSSDAFAIYTSEDIIIEFANDAMLELWGKKRDIIGLPLYQGLPELHGQPFKQILQDVLKTGKTKDGIISAQVSIDGVLQTHLYEYEYKAVLDHSGIPYAILHRANVVTERERNRKVLAIQKSKVHDLNVALSASNEALQAKNEELNIKNEALSKLNLEIIKLNQELSGQANDLKHMLADLSESENRFRTLVDQAPVAVFMVEGADLVIRTANSLMLSMIGKDHSVIGKGFFEALPEIKEQPFANLLHQVYQNGEVHHGRELFARLNKNGRLTDGYFNFVHQPIKNSTGSTKAIVCVAFNITEQVLARKAAEQAQNHLELALQASKLGTWTIEWQTEELMLSERFRQLYGIDGDPRLSLEEFFQSVDPAYKDKVYSAVLASKQSQCSFTVEYLVNTGSPKLPRWLRSTGKTWFDQFGKASITTGTIMDITEERLNQQRKNDFISMVSHELKTPLTSVKGYVQLLKQKIDKDHSSTMLLYRIDKQVNQMTTLINGFLNVSRFASDKIYLEKRDFDMSILIKELLDDHFFYISSHKILLSKLDHAVVNADYNKISQVILNFVSNATKYAPAGTSIMITCCKLADRVQLSVKDQGRGINPENIPKLFELYYRAESGNNDNTSGFGIGLYLCYEIIQQHGGRIWVDSTPGHGSTFHFSLPL